MARPGQTFEDPEVAKYYRYRPEYPGEIYRKLVDISPGHGSALDLGCGTGKITRGLAPHFASITAIDASAAMLRIADSQQPRDVRNIAWLCGLAEDKAFEDNSFDLIVAAASIHWMDHATLFPKLLSAAKPDHVFAVVNGDSPFKPPWQRDWDRFLAYWIYELKGELYEPDRTDTPFHEKMNRYRDWVDITGETLMVSEPIMQSVEHFIACQHSRDTFAPSKLGPRIREFDQALARILEPHAVDGVIEFSVGSTVSWGRLNARD